MNKKTAGNKNDTSIGVAGCVARQTNDQREFSAAKVTRNQ